MKEKQNLKNWGASDAIEFIQNRFRCSLVALAGDESSKKDAVMIDRADYDEYPVMYDNETPVPFSHLNNISLAGNIHCGCSHDCCGCNYAWEIESSYNRKLGVLLIVITNHYNR